MFGLQVLTLAIITFVPILAVEPRVGIGDLNPSLAAEIEAIKTTLESVQGSLITSVGLIQDQVEQFGKSMTASVDSRLAKIEAKLAIVEDQSQKILEQSNGWEGIQHHVQSWGDQMISLDSKVDHLGRSQMESFSTITGQVNSLQTSLTHNVKTITEHISNLETRLQRSIVDSDPDVIASLQRIESKVASTRIRNRIPLAQGQHLHTRGLCSELKSNIDAINTKVETIMSNTKKGLAEALPVNIDDSSDFELVNLSGLESELEGQLIKLFRRLALPFKKANRRLRDMEDIGRQLESTMGEIRTSTQIAAADIDRKFSDFFNMTLEMFDHQHHQIEMSEKSLAGISLCCKGSASDLSEFKAKTESILNKIQSGDLMIPKRNDRTSVQLRFEVNRILAALKDHENLILDGFDQCYIPKAISISNTTTAIPSYSIDEPQQNEEKIMPNYSRSENLEPLEIIPTTTAINSATAAINEGELKVTTTTEMTTDLIEGMPEPISDADKLLMSCEQLLKNGLLESKIYTINDVKTNNNDNEDHEDDFHPRFCDQNTSGGGWTVIQRRGGENPKINFTRTWEEYQNGFGNLNEEFWIGMEMIHNLTNERASPMSLRIELEDFNNTMVVAEYSQFRIDSVDYNYRLWINGFSGNATDSFSGHNGSEFSTVDNINDRAPKCCPCARAYGGGWWFHSCFESNLNGEYHENPLDNDYYRGIIWELWRGDYSLKSSKMMIRSRAFQST